MKPSKVVVALGGMMVQYGCKSIGTWFEIEELLNKSQKEFEDAEAYEEALKYYRDRYGVEV